MVRGRLLLVLGIIMLCVPIVMGDGVRPDILNIRSQTILFGESFRPIPLSEHVLDHDTDDANLTWSVRNARDIIVSIGANQVATIDYSDINRDVSEVVEFVVRDNDGNEDVNFARFTVLATPYQKSKNEDNAPPKLIDIPGQVVRPGDHFDAIRLSDIVEDRDDDDEELYWLIEGEGRLIPFISDGFVFFETAEPFVGQESVLFHVVDPWGLSDTQEVLFIVAGPGGGTNFGPEYEKWYRYQRNCVVMVEDVINVPQMLPDIDCDDIPDRDDNCPLVANPDQLDQNANDIGNACDVIISRVELQTPAPLQGGRGILFEVTATNLGPRDHYNLELGVEAPYLETMSVVPVDYLPSGGYVTKEILLRLPPCFNLHQTNFNGFIQGSSLASELAIVAEIFQDARCTDGVGSNVIPEKNSGIAVSFTSRFSDPSVFVDQVYGILIIESTLPDSQTIRLDVDPPELFTTVDFVEGRLHVLPAGGRLEVALVADPVRNLAPGEYPFLIEVKGTTWQKEFPASLVVDSPRNEMSEAYFGTRGGLGLGAALGIVIAAIIYFLTMRRSGKV